MGADPAARQEDGGRTFEHGCPVPRVARVRLAESVAALLRDQIIGGDLPDGHRLPSVERLCEEYQVGPPAIREALRILENEGLITVLRGNVGGAVVHAPTQEAVAYALSLVLRSAQVLVSDFADAWGGLEALCAAACARRPDRAETVVPALREVHEASSAELEGPGTAFEQLMARFHATLAERCANRTLTLLTGMMSRLWDAQEDSWARHVDDSADWPSPELRRRGIDFHARALAAIERGDADAATAIRVELASHPMHFGPHVGPVPLHEPFRGKLSSAKA
jgi:DNA-binding FadR family transcriptional regulator